VTGATDNCRIFQFKARRSRLNCVFVAGNAAKLNVNERPSPSGLLLIAAPQPRPTGRVSELIRLFGLEAGGLASEKLLTRLGLATTILRHASSSVMRKRTHTPLHCASSPT